MRLSSCLLGLANQLPQFGNIIPGASKERARARPLLSLSTADIRSSACEFRKVPICDIARERRGLVEGHTDPLLFAPDDVTRNVRAVRLKDKIETIGDVAGVSNFERRPRNGNVAD
jgi:hypothetical protein